MKKIREVKIGEIKISNANPIILIAGPCVIEKETSCLDCARELKKISLRMQIPFIFKSSLNKANRTSHKSYRGPGIKKRPAFARRFSQLRL